MAITILNRPRQIYYYTQDSPPTPVYSNCNAAWNPIVYSFNVVDNSDILSSLVLNIYEVGTNTLLASNTIRPFRTGTWNVDISPYVRVYLFSEYKTNFSTNDNCKDAGNNINFYITYTQLFDNESPSIFNTEQSKPVTAICSAMQFGNAKGGNMGDYTPFNFDLPEASKMKFLSVFKKPILWNGWPFTLSFIYHVNILGVQNIKREVQRDSNKNELITTDTELDELQIGSVNYLKINNPNQMNAQSVLVSLLTGEPIEARYVDEGYVDDGYTQII